MYHVGISALARRFALDSEAAVLGEGKCNNNIN